MNMKSLKKDFFFLGSQMRGDRRFPTVGAVLDVVKNALRSAKKWRYMVTEFLNPSPLDDIIKEFILVEHEILAQTIG